MSVFYRTIVPDFFVGREPWDPAADWSTFPEWIKSRNAREVNRYVIDRLEEELGFTRLPPSLPVG